MSVRCMHQRMVATNRNHQALGRPRCDTTGRVRALPSRVRIASVSKLRSRAMAEESEPVLNVEIERLEIGGVRLQVCAPADMQDIVELAEACSDGAACACRTPYWGKVWPSGEALAAQLLQFPLQAICSGASSVADVGAGVGVAGLAAAAAGAQRVTLFEVEPLALDLAAESAALMGCESISMYDSPDWYLGVQLNRGISYSLMDADDEDEMELDTTGSGMFAELQEPMSNTELSLVCGDWQDSARDAEHAGKHDLLLASDVLYGGTEAAAGLAPALASLLGPKGTLAVADPAMRTPGASRDAFIEAAKEAGLVLEGATDITINPEDLSPEDAVHCSILLMLFRKQADDSHLP